MCRVTFAITSSPFLATQVLRHLADEYASLHTAAAKEIKQSFYVDDVLTGAKTVEQAIQLRKEINLFLSKGCMMLRKWRASHISCPHLLLLRGLSLLWWPEYLISWDGFCLPSCQPNLLSKKLGYFKCPRTHLCLGCYSKSGQTCCKRSQYFVNTQ